MHCDSSDIQDQILFLLDNFFYSSIAKEVKRWQQPVPDHFGESEKFFNELPFFG